MEVNLAAEPVPVEPLLPSGASRKLPREILLLGGFFLVLAAILRLIHISYREIFGIEFFTLSFVRGEHPGFPEMILRGYLPLYYELLRLMSMIYRPDSELLLRLPSVVFGLATCVAFFAFARAYLRRTAFAICLLAFALNPILISISNEASPFALLSLWVVLSNFYCIKSLDEGGTRNWTLYTVTSVLGALTHPLFWFLLLAHFVFALARPAKTPKAFVAISILGILAEIAGVFAILAYAHQHFPNMLQGQSLASSQAMRGIVSIVMGNLARYGSREFLRALMYVFVLLTLALSVLFYRRRVSEAQALPEHVAWIDETQDVVGTWKRLSLASFLMFQWLTFLIPAICIMMVGSFAPQLKLDPRFFVVCLPSLVILIAAGIDAIRNRWAAGVLIFIFVVMMAIYDVHALTDRGFGVYDATIHLQKKGFDPSKDVLLYVTYPGLERAVARYAKNYPAVEFPERERIEETNARLEKALQGKQRVFVFYHDDYLRFRKTSWSPVRSWFTEHSQQWTPDDKWVLSVPENTELRIYRRVK